MKTLTDKGRLFLAASVLALAGLARPAAAQTITELPLPSSGSSPYGVAVGTGGDVWFTEFSYAPAIGRISANGAVTEFPISSRDAAPAGIAAGPDGNIWFTAADFDLGTVSLIGRMTPAGLITEFRLSNSLSIPCDITAGPDGNLWFTECNINGNAIGRITTAGAVTEFPLPTSGMGYYPSAITAGPDGNLWFTEPSVNRIGRITTAGAITEFQLTGPSSSGGIAAGPDGNVWFTESDANRIGRITAAGLITEFEIPTEGSYPLDITAGPDGALWFTEASGNKIGRITTAGAVTEFPAPTAESGPVGITVGQDGTIWFAETSGNRIGRISFAFSGVADLSADPDGGTRLLRLDAGSGRTSLDSLDVAGSVSRGASYGPYPGWTARAASTGTDALTRILWTSEDGSASLWFEGPEGNRGSVRFDPTPGWTAADVAAGIGGTTHLLWTGADASAALWSVDNAGRVAAKAIFGPYAGWTASAISDGADGLTRLLWEKADGTAGLSILSSGDLLATYRYAPDGPWRAVDAGVGGESQTRILWSHPDGRVAVGIVSGSGDDEFGPIASSPAGLKARHIAVGPDGSSRVLFTDEKGGAVIWLLSPAGMLVDSLNLSAPKPPEGIAGTWMGIWRHTSNPGCPASVTDSGIFAQVFLEQAGSTVRGTLTTDSVPCGWGTVTYAGTLDGDTLLGAVRDEDGLEFPAAGLLSGSSLEITIDNGGGYFVGQLRLHR